MKNNSFKRLMAAALCLCMLLSLYVPSVSAAEITKDYHAKTISEILALDEDLTWVFTGDSITHNGAWTGGYNDYAAWFERYLYDIGRGDDTLINTAWGGAAIDHFLPTRSGSDGMGLANFVTKYNPDVVFIKLGMNNRKMDDATFASKYNEMLDGIYEAGAKNGKKPKVILLSPTPLSGEFGIESGEFGADPTNEGYYDSVKRFSINLSNIASQRGLLFVDLRQAMVNESAVLGDRYHYTFFSDPSDGLIHPNGAGQYFMFKTICKTLGLYDASMPIFKVSYDDITDAALYDSPEIGYTGSYGTGIVDADDVEMDKDMPELEKNDQPVLLAAADLTETNGKFGADEGETRYIDLMDGSVMTDALTADEVKAMGKEYSVVFRAKLENADFDFANHSVALYMSANKESKWSDTNTLMVSFPGKHATNGYYGDGNMASSTGVKYGNVRTAAMDGKWHTFAVVQSESKLVMYVDGVAYDLNANYYLKQAIGTYFADAIDANTFDALFGSYGSASPDAAYGMDGWVDYVQLYNGALDAEEVAHLTTNGGKLDDATQMNKTMPTLEGVAATASIDFTSANGSLDFGSSAGIRIDEATEGYEINTLTQNEATALGTDFTVVFNAKLGTPYQTNQPILFISSDGTANWDNALVLGTTGKNNQLFYDLMRGTDDKQSKLNTGGAINLSSGATVAGDGEWHTVAITIAGDTLTYYVDGVQVDQVTGYDLKSDYTSIGSLFENANNFAAQIGRYGTEQDGTGYKLKGDFNYWQFYSTALSAEQLNTLTTASIPSDAEQMNATMPKLPAVEYVPNLLASVDFNSTNGVITYNNTDSNAGTVDLTNGKVMDDVLTLAEAQSMGKEYSVVFRYKSNVPSGRKNLPLLYMAGTDTGGFAAQTDKLLMGMPGTENIYYQAYVDNASISTLSGATTYFGNLRTDMNNGQWHTIAVVQSTSGLTYYVDGTAYPVTADANGKAVVLSQSIGSMFADITTDSFDAVIGRYGEDDKNWKTQGKFDFWQLYDGALSASQIQTLSTAGEDTVEAAAWTDTVVANSVWAVVGADQMSGYLGEDPNFSMFRLLNNGMRGGSSRSEAYRDIRMMNLAKPGQTVSDVVANYDDVLGEHKSVYNVLMLLPEVPEVHAAGYVHSADKVAAYKANIQTLIEKNADKAIVLWSPLASSDATINGYITDYANAVREIIGADPTVLFFDANKFMNERIASEGTNWFDDSMHITPLCATDLVYAFYVHANYPTYSYTDTAGNTYTNQDRTNKDEILSHNLRYSTDTRTYKNGYKKSNLSYDVTVTGDSIYVDASAIASAYNGISNLRVAVLPAIGIGSNVDPWILGSVGQNLTAPHSNPVITVYGEYNGFTYRFKDVQLSLTTANNQTGPYTETSDLTALEVVGAPAIGFDPSKTTYDVELYQYQQQVRIVAEGGDNLTIKVNGQAVEPGAFSQYIAVASNATVTVTVNNGTADKTYTLNLTRPNYADIIVTEVMTDGYSNYTKGGADNYELIEIYNASGRDLNLLDYSIGYLREYPYANDNILNGSIPYYFTGNDHNFFGNSYLGINQITKYSSYWEDKVDQEPTEVLFPADSTMVIWVKFSKDSGTAYGSSLTYETLIGALEAHSGTHTLTVDVEEGGTTVTKTIVPTMDQLVVAEIPYGAAQNNVTQRINTSATNFYMDNFSKQQNYNNRRGWLFVLDDSAVRDYYGALTTAGDDIISAAKYVRPGSTDKLSNVMYYDVTRGMSVVKNPGYWDSNFSTGHTSSQQGYANLTSFGAVEYWQKPYDFGDTTAAVIDNKTPAGVLKGDNATIELAITDDQDIRYLELYVDANNDGTYETVIKKDITLITSATNGGKALDVKSHTETFALSDLQNTVKYYGFVLDGNNNKTELGSAAAPKTIEIVEPGQLRVNASVLNEAGEASDAEIEVSITLSQGTSPVGIGGNYVVYNSEDKSVGNLTSGSGSVTVGNGGALIVKGLPEGATYTLTVRVPSGYEDLTPTENLTGVIGSTEGATTVSAQKILLTGDLTVSANVKRLDDSSAGETAASVVITLAKGTSPVDLAESYVVEDANGTKLGDTANNTITLSLADGQKATVKGLPVGVAYTVTATAPEGYENKTTGSTNSALTSADGATVALSFKEILVTGDLAVSASVKKVDDTASDKKVTVKIDLTQGTAGIAPTGTYQLVSDKERTLPSLQNGTATFTMEDGEKVTVKGLPVGTEYTVTVTPPTGYEDKTDATVTTGNVVKDGSSVDVAVKEKLITGGLTVNAVVKKVDGAASAEEVTVKIQLAKGDSPVNLEPSYTVVDGSGTELGKTTGGAITVTLGNGEKAVIADLPAGAAYTVTVTLPDGYADESTDATTGKVDANGSDVTVALKELLVTGNLTVNATVKEVDGANSDEKITVKIDLTKGNAPIDLENTYQIVDGSGKELGTVTNGTATIELSNGQTAIVKDVAEGAAYTVTVTPPAGYESTATGTTTGNVAKTGSTADVSVKEKLITGALTVKMDLNDCAGADADSTVKASVKIKVVKGDAPVDLGASYDILNGKGTKIGTLTNGEATVELANGGIAKIADLPAGASYTVTVTVPEGYDNITSGATAGKVVAAGSNVTVALQEQVKEGQFYISASIKEVDGTASTAKANVVITLAKTNSPVDLADSYDILDENGTKIGSTTNGTATLSMADGDKAVISGLPEGASYTVKITVPTGYENKTSAATTTGIIGTDSGAVACEVAEILKTGEVSVTAELKTEDGETVTDEKVTVTVTLSKGLSPVELAASYDIVNAGGVKIGTVTNGTATFKLASGEKATVKDLPQGAAFVVSLTTPEGYENTTTGTTTGNVAATPVVVSLKVTEKAPTETTKETDPTETTKAPSVTPPTGDASGVGVWMAVMGASAVLLCLMAAVMALLGRKSKSRR